MVQHRSIDSAPTVTRPVATSAGPGKRPPAHRQLPSLAGQTVGQASVSRDWRTTTTTMAIPDAHPR